MILDRFARFAVASREDDLPGDVAHAATRVILDWYAATVAGTESAPAQVLAKALVNDAETGPARLIPSGRAVPARVAALINGTASHTAEIDDIYRDGLYHPGSPTVAAALAAAELRGVSGPALLRGVAVGFEVGDRIAAAVQPAHYTYWHTTGTVGTIGAAAAAAEVLGLDAQRFAHALATSVTMAAGLQQAFRSDAMSKPLHAGHAAEAGLLAALAAEGGFTGALDVLEGEAGFGAGMAAGTPDWEAAVTGLGEPWLVTRTTVKNHSCCGHTFAPVDAVLALREGGLTPARVREIRVATYGAALKVAGQPDPRTVFEAKFSIAYCVSAALSLGSVRRVAFEPEAMASPEIRELIGKTTLSVDPGCEAAFPSRRSARVVIVDTDGAEHEHYRATRRGDPDDPLSDDDLSQKFAEFVTPVIGAGKGAGLADALWCLADLDDVRNLGVQP
ncbi:MAG: MmgE/PrpD family protein [Streptosporangiales bacterium]|nr:MmgE/PrpD family protein [Streptosporangiales bacterium]